MNDKMNRWRGERRERRGRGRGNIPREYKKLMTRDAKQRKFN